MKYDQQRHHRRSIRLKGYDYSKAGLYFVTLCCKERFCYFGQIDNGQMIMNDAGLMVEKWYRELENKFPDKRCHEMIVMPNHFHCIIENFEPDVSVTDPAKTGTRAILKKSMRINNTALAIKIKCNHL